MGYSHPTRSQGRECCGKCNGQEDIKIPTRYVKDRDGIISDFSKSISDPK